MIGMFGMATAATALRTGVGTMAAASGARAESKIQQAERHIKLLEANLAKALMISESLWEILKEKQGLTDEDLQKTIHQVDMRDGALDGKNQRNAAECPNCKHMVSARHAVCLYCGEIIDTSVFSLS